MKLIDKIVASNREKQTKRKEKEEASVFNITEKEGVIYIIAGQRAIRTVPKTATASEIIKMLNECRDAQISFIK